MKRVSQLPGVTAADAQRLAEGGVRSVGDLARLQDLGILSAGLSLPLDLLEHWREEAREETRSVRSRRRRLVASAAVILIILAVALAFLGRESKSSGPREEPAGAYQNPIRLDPGEIGDWQNRARAYREAGRWEEAISAYREVVRRDPKDWDAHFEIGWILLQQGEPRRQEAIDALSDRRA
jgi:tetratricopeptide (TPR) repeat protein